MNTETIKTSIPHISKSLLELGEKIGKLYTDHGLPLDMSLDRLNLNKNQKTVVLTGACSWFIEHKRRSGATDKAIERQRVVNNRMLNDFVTKGETGIY